MDRLLIFNRNIVNLQKKLRIRVNLVWKLAGTGWDANVSILSVARMALVYSTVEYAVPIWVCSAYTVKVNSIHN